MSVTDPEIASALAELTEEKRAEIASIIDGSYQKNINPFTFLKWENNKKKSSKPYPLNNELIHNKKFIIRYPRYIFLEAFRAVLYSSFNSGVTFIKYS